MEITIQGVCDRWSGLERPLFKGMLIDTDGCCCAQGDVLRLSGRSDDELRDMDQTIADREVARLLGISVAHSVLLRHVNDRQDGCPQDVLLHPERMLGDQAKRVLAFWQRIDFMAPEQWVTIGVTSWDAVRVAAWAAAREAAAVAAWDAAGEAVGVAAWAAVREAARAAAGVAAGVAVGAAAAARATNEIQGEAIMRERGQPFFFLPMFGINDPAELE